jgi:signal transduction histidine kinase
MPRGSRQPGRDDRTARAAAVAVLVAFVVAVYVLIVLGGGLLIGHTDSPHLALSVLATAVVALAFEPVRRRTEAAVTRRFHVGASPYDVLSRFSETVTGGYATDELPGRMVRLLAEGTNAEWAQVWLMVQGRPQLAASWPADATATDDRPPEIAAGASDRTGPGRRAMTVRHGGQVYGVFRLQERQGTSLSSVEERLFAGLAAQAGLVLRLVGLRAELSARHADLAVRTAELRLSRERLIAAQDAERQRLERDIHDGAQQHLVALAVNLRLVESVAAKDPGRAAGLLQAQADAARAAGETLSRLASGMYPAHLATAGVAAALRAELAAAPVPVDVVDHLRQRLPEPIEAALYFVAMEAVQNAAKHANATAIAVELTGDEEGSRLTVADDGVGLPTTTSAGGSGLSSMHDRIDAVGGTVCLETSLGQGTRVVATVPTQRAAP